MRKCCRSAKRIRRVNLAWKGCQIQGQSRGFSIGVRGGMHHERTLMIGERKLGSHWDLLSLSSCLGGTNSGGTSIAEE